MAQRVVLSLYDTKYRNLFSFSPDKVMEFFFLSKTNPFAQELVYLSFSQTLPKVYPLSLIQFKPFKQFFPTCYETCCNQGEKKQQSIQTPFFNPCLPIATFRSFYSPSQQNFSNMLSSILFISSPSVLQSPYRNCTNFHSDIASYSNKLTGAIYLFINLWHLFTSK